MAFNAGAPGGSINLGVSSFGAQGTNAHALITGPPGHSVAASLESSSISWQRTRYWIVPASQAGPRTLHSRWWTPYLTAATSWSLGYIYIYLYALLYALIFALCIYLFNCMPSTNVEGNGPQALVESFLRKSKVSGGAMQMSVVLSAPRFAELWQRSASSGVSLPASVAVAAADSAASILLSDDSGSPSVTITRALATAKTRISSRLSVDCCVPHFYFKPIKSYKTCSGSLPFCKAVQCVTLNILRCSGCCSAESTLYVYLLGLAIAGELVVSQPQLLRRRSKLALDIRLMPATGLSSVSSGKQRLLQCSLMCTGAVLPFRGEPGDAPRRGPSPGLLSQLSSGVPIGCVARSSAFSFTQCMVGSEESGTGVHPAQVEASLQLAAMLINAADGLQQWSQAGAIHSQPSTLQHSRPGNTVLCGPSTAQSTIAGFDAISEAYSVRGMVLSAKSAVPAASAAQATGAASPPEEEAEMDSQPLSAALQSLAALPQAARLLRIEAQVCLRDAPSRACLYSIRAFQTMCHHGTGAASGFIQLDGGIRLHGIKRLYRGICSQTTQFRVWGKT